MGVSGREGGGRLYDFAADCELGKGWIAERTRKLGKRRRMAAHMWYNLLRRVGMAVTTTLLAGSWVRGG